MGIPCLLTMPGIVPGTQQVLNISLMNEQGLIDVDGKINLNFLKFFHEYSKAKGILPCFASQALCKSDESL